VLYAKEETMPVWEIVIKGKFVTGTTIDDEEQAKETRHNTKP